MALADDERDALRDWWDEETTVSVESAFPIIARIVARAERQARFVALREAADDAARYPFGGNGHPAFVGWLRARADRITT